MGVIITRTVCPCCREKDIKKVLVCKDHTVSNEIFEIWQCAACALRFTQHVPSPEAIIPYYQSDAYISHSDTEKGIVNKLYKIARNYTISWKMKLVKRHTAKRTTPATLLDIGAGTGAFLNQAKATNWQAYGVEPDEGARNICFQKYQIKTESNEKLYSFPSSGFDAITLWHVLEHVHELHEYFIEIRRILKKDGTAFIALPNYTSHDANHYSEYWAAYDVPRHLYHFAPATVRILAAQHQMKVELINPMWLDAFYISMLSEQYKTAKNKLLTAISCGLASNWAALENKEKCSSLVYVIRHI